MAEMIPDSCPAGASAGEKNTFAILQQLPDDYIVYYEPIIARRYPDFIVICPDLGVLIIEVKGWYPKHIQGGDDNDIQIMERENNVVAHKHPCRQAREYMYQLMDICREQSAKYKEFKSLIQADGENKGKFIFPFGYLAVLSNISSEQMKKHPIGDLTKIFPPDRVVPRDMLSSWSELDKEEVRNRIKSFFNPLWKFPPLTEKQIDALRAIIHPELKLNPKQVKNDSAIIEESKPLKILDIHQEKLANKIGAGHRVITGVAGSGKTVILLSRAKRLSQDNPEGKILLLCYNVSLSEYLKTSLTECKNVEVYHFDGWSRKIGVTRNLKQNETNDEFGQRLFDKLEFYFAKEEDKYLAILVDEAQDFPAIWFKCILEALRDKEDGDLIIVSDGNQGIYKPKSFKWSDVGINARGKRTYFKEFGLDKNYRNSREILQLASLFAEGSPADHDGDSIAPIMPSEQTATRSTGFNPLLIECQDRNAEFDEIIKIVQSIASGQWNGKPLPEKLKASDIGIFYPYLSAKMKPDFLNFIEALKKVSKAVVWISDKEDREARRKINEPGIKIQTIHSAKGLQYKAVILMWADMLPKTFGNVDIEEEKRLLYVALTRAEDYLAITYTGRSVFIDEMKKIIK